MVICGRFRWVSLSLQNLPGLTIEPAVSKRLGRLPTDLQQLYEETYVLQLETGDLDQISIAQDAFRLLLCLHHPLKPSDFLLALNQCGGDRDSLSKEDLLEICLNFVVHDEKANLFRFAHLSVQEFLESKPDFKKSRCHGTAAMYCLHYLSTDLFVELNCSNSVRKRLYSRLVTCEDYASLFWPYHLHLSREHRLLHPLKATAFDFTFGTSTKPSPFDHWSRKAFHLRGGWKMNLYHGRTSTARLSTTGNDLMIHAFGLTNPYQIHLLIQPR